MRVLMNCPELPSADRPGSMAPAARQFESLRELGHSVDAIDMRGTPVLKYIQALPILRKRVREADVVHAHFGYCGWLCYLAMRGMRKPPPLVISFMGDDLLGTPYNVRGDLEWFSRQMVKCNRLLARRAKHVIVKSQEMSDVLDTPCTIIPNGVDTQTFQPMDQAEARQRLKLLPDKKYVLFPGDPSNPRKGFALAEKAKRITEQRCGPVEFLTLWKIDPAQVPLFMNACDVMTMTSQIEGSPNVVKEAMACNTPIVGVPVGDVHQLLEGVDGCCRCERDPNQVAAAMMDLMNRTRRSQGRRAIESRGLDLTSVARRVVSVYSTALSVNRPTKSSRPSVQPQPDRPWSAEGEA